MATSFLDTSALVKRHVAESGYAWIETLCDPHTGKRIVTAEALRRMAGPSTIMRGRARTEGRSKVMEPWKHDRIGSAERGENPMVLLRMRSGFAVFGDTQVLPGYCLLLAAPEANHLSDLPFEPRREFLFDMSLLGEAIEAVCRPRGLRRMNYELLGNTDTYLHAHVFPRYEWEPAEYIGGPVWGYPREVRNDPRQAYSDAAHGQLRQEIITKLRALMAAAGVAPEE
jgi:diadenosine tetraphosphate (Ap4A) HIT family hydrolase